MNEHERKPSLTDMQRAQIAREQMSGCTELQAALNLGIAALAQQAQPCMCMPPDGADPQEDCPMHQQAQPLTDEKEPSADRDMAHSREQVAAYTKGYNEGFERKAHSNESKRCPDCDQAKVNDPKENHSYHCIAGEGPTCLGCYSCRCGKFDCTSQCHCFDGVA